MDCLKRVEEEVVNQEIISMVAEQRNMYLVDREVIDVLIKHGKGR